MTNNEAIQTLDQATARLPLNREGHVLIQQALQTIKVALSKLTELEEAAKKKK